MANSDFDYEKYMEDLIADGSMHIDEQMLDSMVDGHLFYDWYMEYLMDHGIVDYD